MYEKKNLFQVCTFLIIKNKLAQAKICKDTKNDHSTKENMIKQLENPNDIAPYKNTNNEKIEIIIWTTNTIDSYFTITFTNNVAILESG